MLSLRHLFLQGKQDFLTGVLRQLGHVEAASGILFTCYKQDLEEDPHPWLTFSIRTSKYLQEIEQLNAQA